MSNFPPATSSYPREILPLSTLTVLDHALARDRLTRMRGALVAREEFSRLVEQLAVVLAVEAGRKLDTCPCQVQTPLEETTGDALQDPVCLVPILRAGLGLLKGFQVVFPEAVVGHLGLKRDEATLQPSLYLEKLPPDLSRHTVMVLDPMLATGRSASEALKRLKGLGAVRLMLVCCLAAPEGVREVRASHPDVAMLIAGLDRQLDARGYILPGLGDAGDRQFGTT